jgi:hypothetical protein
MFYDSRYIQNLHYCPHLIAFFASQANIPFRTQMTLPERMSRRRFWIANKEVSLHLSTADTPMISILPVQVIYYFIIILYYNEARIKKTVRKKYNIFLSLTNNKILVVRFSPSRRHSIGLYSSPAPCSTGNIFCR